jgi:hypothetical protein
MNSKADVRCSAGPYKPDLASRVSRRTTIDYDLDKWLAAGDSHCSA